MSGLGILWRDYSGRFSWLNAVVLITVCLPGLSLPVAWVLGNLGPRPLNEAIHGTGQEAVRLLLASLAVSPARAIFDWKRLILVRRMLGLAAASYALTHFSLYVADQQFALLHVASEIIHRFYLTIGFVTLSGLAILAAASTDSMMRRLRRNWQRLHRLIYILVALALWHFFLQSKRDVTEAALTAGLFVWLMLWRAVPKRLQRNLGVLLLLAPLAGVATACLETAWYWLATGINAEMVWEANFEFDLDFGLRPSAWVTICGLMVVVAAALKQGSKRFFFEKKKQKTFVHFGVERVTGDAPSE